MTITVAITANVGLHAVDTGVQLMKPMLHTPVVKPSLKHTKLAMVLLYSILAMSF